MTTERDEISLRCLPCHVSMLPDLKKIHLVSIRNSTFCSDVLLSLAWWLDVNVHISEQVDVDPKWSTLQTEHSDQESVQKSDRTEKIFTFKIIPSRGPI